MNKIINSEWEHYMSFRLQTVRRKKRMQREDFEKRLLSLNKERNQLCQQKWKLGWVELHPPVMRGWKRFFVLREATAKSKQAAFFEGVLQKINTVHYSHRKDFKVKKRKGGKKIYVATEQQLLRPEELWFRTLNLNDNEAQFFEARYFRKEGRRELQKVYVFTEPWHFVLRIRPNIITKVRVRDVAIEKRIDEIDRFLRQRDLDGKLSRLRCGHSGWKYKGESDREKNFLKNHPLQHVLDETKLLDVE